MDAKCARQAFIIGGAAAAGRMEVYCKSPIAGGDLKSGIPNAPAGLSWDGGASAAGRMEVYCSNIKIQFSNIL